ncbi:uncharacterized protein LOC122804576 [Protopterus annectens]|uniref:uncharacterized protein LOC122804576 n=1 Tax=Protopterus annectens TaxID=7888 RepID=UPI001CFBA28F|nr:uncharacterized protein LOC122804576 [Protopterus annectens]
MDQVVGQVRTKEHWSNSLPDCSNGDMTCQVHKTVQHKPEDKTISNEYEATCEGTSMTLEEVIYMSKKTCKICRLSGAMFEILEGIATIPKSVMKKKDIMKTSLQDIVPVNKSNVRLNDSSNNAATVLFEGKKEHRSATVSDFRTSDMTCIWQDKNQHTPDEKRTANEESGSRENGSLTAKKLGSGPEATPETPDHDRKSPLLSDAPHGSKELSGDKKKKKHIQRKILKALGIGRPDNKLGGTINSQNENSRNKEQSLTTMSHSTDDNVICTQQDENQHTSDESSSTEESSTCETRSWTPQNIGSSPEKTINIPNSDKRSSLLLGVPSLTKALSDVKKKKKKIKKKIQKKLFQSHKNALPDDKLGNADSYQEENSNKSVAILLEGRNKEQSLTTMSHSTDDNVICTQQDENQHTSDESSSTEDSSTCETRSWTPQNIGSSPEKTINIPNSDKRSSLLLGVPSLTKALSDVKKKEKKDKKEDTKETVPIT